MLTQPEPHLSYINKVIKNCTHKMYTHARTHARTHPSFTHTHTHTHTLYRPIGVKDSVAELKYLETRNALSLLLKEERVA